MLGNIYIFLNLQMKCLEIIPLSYSDAFICMYIFVCVCVFNIFIFFGGGIIYYPQKHMAMPGLRSPGIIVLQTLY